VPYYASQGSAWINIGLTPITENCYNCSRQKQIPIFTDYRFCFGTFCGAGVFVWRTDSVTIENNAVIDNRAKSNGGGFYIGNRASATLRMNTLENNTALSKGGAIWIDKDSMLYLASPNDNIYTGNLPDNIYRR
jgi:parallel beta-helix repeat protein